MALGTIRSALAAACQTASVRRVYARPPETVADVPAVVVGTIAYEVTPGEREVTVYHADVEIWTARLPDDDSAIATADTVADEIRASLATQVTLGGTVSHAFIVGGRGNEWTVLGGSEYCLTTLTVEITERRTRSYAP